MIVLRQCSAERASSKPRPLVRGFCCRDSWLICVLDYLAQPRHVLVRDALEIEAQFEVERSRFRSRKGVEPFAHLVEQRVVLIGLLLGDVIFSSLNN